MVQIASFLLPHQFPGHAALLNPCLRSETWGILRFSPHGDSRQTHPSAKCEQIP